MKRFLIILFAVSTVSCFAQHKKYRKQGDEYLAIGRYNEALHFYEMAIPGFKQDALLYQKIGECYALRSDGKKCMESMLKCFKYTKDTSQEMHYSFARGLHLLHKFDEAIKHYKKSDPYKKHLKRTQKRLKECSFGKKYIASPVKVKITNMGERVNSKQHDVLPQITADRQLLIFTSHRPGAVGGENPEDIYISVNKGGAWEKPFNAGKPLSTENNDACIGLSNDGQTMYIFKGSNGGDIYESTLKGEKWSTPKQLPFNTENKESSACLAPDGKTLYFVRQYDKVPYIYKVRRTAGGTRWSKPVRVSRTINSDHGQESPFIHADGKTLYFSSKGHSSMGGYDIFKSVKTSKGWSKPINLGYPINTAGDDWGFVMAADGLFGYYASAKSGGFGAMDLYTIRMPPPKKKPNLALLKGEVKEEFTEKPVEAKITVTDNEINKIVGVYKSNSKTGEYLISLPAGKNYGIAIEKAGHLFHSENVYLADGAEFVMLQKDIKLVNVKKGSKIILKNIFFDSSEWELRSESYGELDRLVDIMKQTPNLKVEISGHTDNRGDPNANMKLSEYRAKAVVDYLVEKGIERNRLVPKGYGITKPVAPNTTDEGRQKNRRTEFEIIED